MLIRLLNLLVRGLLSLRYRVQILGLDAVAQRGTAGILFLPNHPALIDPVILLSRLLTRFQVRPLADQDQVDLPLVRTVSRWVGVRTLPDLMRHGEAGRPAVEQAIADCADGLRRGENVLIYPAGHISRSRHEDLAGNSAVETLLQQVPEARVVLVRTRGLWGSSFSRASGAPPRLTRVLWNAVRTLLLNGVFFGPRRNVTLELQEPPDRPQPVERKALNRWLEQFYNADAPPCTYVPYTWWEGGKTRSLPDPVAEGRGWAVEEVPALTRDLVVQQLRNLTGRREIRPEDALSRDLGLDSLSLVDLAMWVESEFGFAVSEGVAFETVSDVMFAACGHFAGPGVVELTPVPRAWFRHGGPAVRTDLPPGESIMDVVLAQARQRPCGVVLADQASGVRSHRDLVTALLVLQPELAALPGDYVGIMLPASVAATTLVLAVLQAGKIPVMVNWTAGARNMAHALDLLSVQSVLTSQRLVAKLESQGMALDGLRERFVLMETLAVRLTRGRKLAAWLRTRLALRHVRPGRAHPVAVVLFTSGSESLPKAVPLTHRNLLTNLRDLCRVFPFQHADRLLGMLPPFHSFGLTVTCLLPVCTGVPVVYHANPTEGGMLARLIEAYRVTLLAGTPTFVAGILRAARGPELASVHTAICGAEKCPLSLHDTVARLWPHLRLLEGYGITECSPVVSVNDWDQPRPGTIGRVLPSLQWALVDLETGRAAAPDHPGMLLVRGDSVFENYLHHTGPSPFVDFDGRRWYRTGDLVSAGADGVLTFVGRLKRFVKLGGEMISLPAIEEILIQRYVKTGDEEPVLAVEGTPVETNPELVLFTIRDLDRDDVNRTLRDAGLSPLHNIRRVIRLPKIPVLGTGKTDYRTLKASLTAPEPGA